MQSCFIVDLFLYIYQIFELETFFVGNNSHISSIQSSGVESREKTLFSNLQISYILFISVMLWMLNINNPLHNIHLHVRLPFP